MTTIKRSTVYKALSGVFVIIAGVLSAIAEDDLEWRE